MDRAFSPLQSKPNETQAFGLGWYVVAPLVLPSAAEKFERMRVGIFTSLRMTAARSTKTELLRQGQRYTILVIEVDAHIRRLALVPDGLRHVISKDHIPARGRARSDGG